MEMAPSPPPMSVQPSPNTNSDEPVLVHNDAPKYSTQTETEADAQREISEDARKEQLILNVKFLNGCSFLLTAMLTIGIVTFGVRVDGVWGDQFLWMKYQTLITPSRYVNIIWFVLFAFQGLYVYASIFHKEYSMTPLVGYSLLGSDAESAKRSVAAIYPGVCAATLLMIFSHDHGHIGLAFVASLVTMGLLVKIMKIQMEVLDELANNPESETADETEEAGHGLTKVLSDDNINLDRDDPNHPFSRDSMKKYISLRLPFELYGGYALTLCFLYLNVWISLTSLTPKFLLIIANASLLSILTIGSIVLWKTKRHFYGLSTSLVLYLVGVATELHEPTQPIDNEFSDDQIRGTQAMAALATTVLLAILSIRIVKTIMKRNLCNACENIDNVQDVTSPHAGAGGAVTSGDVEGELSTDYVHA